MSIQASGIISFSDYMDFNRTVIRRAVFKAPVLVILGAAVLAILYMMAGDIIDLIHGYRDFFHSSLFIILLLAVSLAFLFGIIIPLRLKSFYESNRLRYKVDEIVITEERFRFKTDDHRFDVHRDDIKRIIMTDLAIYVFVSGGRAMLIPRHFFDSTEFTGVQEFVKEHFGEKTE